MQMIFALSAVTLTICMICFLAFALCSKQAAIPTASRVSTRDVSVARQDRLHPHQPSTASSAAPLLLQFIPSARGRQLHRNIGELQQENWEIRSALLLAEEETRRLQAEAMSWKERAEKAELELLNSVWRNVDYQGEQFH